MRIQIKKWLSIFVLSVSFIFSGCVFTDDEQGGQKTADEGGAQKTADVPEGDREVFDLGEQKTASWTVRVDQFGSMKDDDSELVFDVIFDTNSNANIDKIKALRVWFGSQDSGSLVMDMGVFDQIKRGDGEIFPSKSKSGDDELLFHGHLTVADGDDYSQFTVEIEAESGESEVLSFKIK